MSARKRLARVLIPMLGVICASASPALSQGSESDPEGVQFHFEQRIRQENWNNLFDYDRAAVDARHQTRLRERAWVSAPLTSSIGAVFGVNSESNERLGQSKEMGEVLVEQAYLHFKHLFLKGLTLRIGRQDLTRGDGLVFSDSSPYDGSRTLYSNAMVLAWTRGRHRVEWIGIANPARDRYLPRIHSQSRMLNEMDERATGFYYSAVPTAAMDVDAYCVLKQSAHSILPASDSRYRPDRHVTISGARLVRRAGAWTASSEMAIERGAQSGDVPIHAWGASWSVKRVLFKPRQWYVSAGYQALSGDDPATRGKVEGWDPMFGRFVKPSELYAYSGMNENGLGYWSNFRGLLTETGIDVSPRLRVKGGWNRFTAPERYEGNLAIFGSGRLRGNNFQARADILLRDTWKAHILVERMLPGDFYCHRAPAYFLRFETSFQFRTVLHARVTQRRQARKEDQF